MNNNHASNDAFPALEDAAFYGRYSSYGQGEQSIEGQQHDAYEFAARNGYRIIHEYIDRATTGTNDNRTAFQQMMLDSAKKQFKVVIVWKLDRFARNRTDSAINKAILKKNGVRVVSVMENITTSPEGIILEGMLESMAEYFSANLSENVKRGLRETLAKGKHTGGRAPYGYKSVDGHFVIDEKTAPVIRFVFEQYAAGTPKKEIADILNRRGVTSSGGGKITVKTFQGALSNTVYIGKYTHSGEVYEGVAEPLIEPELFYKVQERLAAVKRAPAAQKALERYALQGKVFCGHCGSPMIGECGRGKLGKVYHYYTCASRKKLHNCKKKNERKEQLEWYVASQTVSYVLAPHNMDEIAKSVASEFNKDFSSERINELERASARIEKELDNLVDALAEMPKSARPRIAAKMELLESQKSDIEYDIRKLRLEQGIRLTEKEVKAWLRQFCKGDPADPEYRQKLFDTFVNAVYVYDDHIMIFYNINQNKQVSYPAIKETFPSQGSDMTSYALPILPKSEPQKVFVNGVFGVIFHREED